MENQRQIKCGSEHYRFATNHRHQKRSSPVRSLRLDEALVNTVVQACREEAARLQAPDPDRLKQLRVREQRLTDQIRFDRTHPGESEEEQRETVKLLKQLNGDRAGVQSEIASLESATGRKVCQPSENDVRQLIDNLDKILMSAAEGADDGDADQARAVIEQLTGGRILLFQQGERKPQRGWLQGRFHVRLLSYLTEQLTGRDQANADKGVEVIVDYKAPTSFEEEAERAWQLQKQDILHVQIGRQLGCSKSQVTKLLKYAAEKHGEQFVDGRQRRAQLQRKHSEPPLYQRIADEVKLHADEGLLLGEIAKQMQVDRNTITSAWTFWHESRGLQAPDGRARRKTLSKRGQQKSPDPSALDPQAD